MAARTAPGCDSRTRPARSAVAKRDLLVSVRLLDRRDEGFRELWAETSCYFRASPVRVAAAAPGDARYRFVNVAQWASAAQYRAPHLSEEFRNLVSREAWREFPSTPVLYEVVTAVERVPTRSCGR